MSLSRATITESTPSLVFTSTSEHTITSTFICNTGSEDAEVDVHLLSPGDLMTDDNIVYKSIRIPSEDTYVMDFEKISLSSGEAMGVKIRGNSAVVTVTVSHVEML